MNRCRSIPPAECSLRSGDPQSFVRYCATWRRKSVGQDDIVREMGRSMGEHDFVRKLEDIADKIGTLLTRFVHQKNLADVNSVANFMANFTSSLSMVWCPPAKAEFTYRVNWCMLESDVRDTAAMDVLEHLDVWLRTSSRHNRGLTLNLV